MSEFPINEMVSPSAQKELEKLLSELEKINSLAKSTTLSAGDAKSMKELADAQAKLNKLTADEEIQKKKLQALDQKMAIDRQKEIDRQEAIKEKAHQAELKRIEKEAQEQRKKTSEAEKNAKKIADLQAEAAKGDGSYNSLSAQYKLNTIELNKMSKAQKETTDEGKSLVAETARIRKEMNDAKKATGDYTLQVGNYAIATQNAQKNLGEMKAELKMLRGMSFVGKSPEEVAALKLRIGELMDEMGDLKAEMQVMGTEKAAVLVSGLKFISAGVEGVISSLNLMGVESDTVKNLSDKMTSLIAVTQALAEIEDTVSSGKLRAIALRVKDMAMNVIEAVQKKALVISTNALTAAEEAKTVATNKGSIATRAAAAVQWLWNSAILANPIVATVAAVLALTAAIAVLIISQKDTVTWTKKEIAELDRKRKMQENAEQQQQIYNDAVKSGIESGSKEVAVLATLTFNSSKYREELKKLTDEYGGYLTATEKQTLANTNLSNTIDILTQAVIRKAVTDAYTAQMSDQLTKAGEIGVKKAQLESEFDQILALEQKAWQKIYEAGNDQAKRVSAQNALNMALQYKTQKMAQIDAIEAEEKDIKNVIEKIIKNREEYVKNAGITGNVSVKSTVTRSNDAEKDKLDQFLMTNKSEQEALQKTADNEALLMTTRFEAMDAILAKRKEAFGKQKEFDEMDMQRQISKATKEGKTAIEINDLRINLMNEMKSKQIQYEIESTNDVKEFEYKKSEIAIKESQRLTNVLKKSNEKQISDLEAKYKAQITRLEIMANKEYELNAVAYAKGSKSKEDYEKEKLRISTQYAEDQLRLSIEMTEKQLKLLEEIDPVSRTKEENDKIASLHLELSKLKKNLSDQELAREEENWAKRAEMVEKYGETMKEILSTIGSLSSAIFERQSSDLEAQHSKEEEAHQAELDAIDKKYNRSTKAKTAEELAKEKVDKKYAASEKKYEREKAELARKQAIWKKGLAITEAVINTAVSIAKVAYNPAQVILAGIVGAAQIAAIAMEKIPEVPKYRYGTDYHRGGLARFGEAGAELAITPSGQTIYAGSDTIMDLPRGTKVLTASVTREILENKITSANGIDLTSLIEENKKSNNLLSKLVQKQQKSVIFVADNSRYNNYKYN